MLFEVRTDRSWGTTFTVTELSLYSLFVLCCREFNSEGKLGGGGDGGVRKQEKSISKSTLFCFLDF